MLLQALRYFSAMPLRDRNFGRTRRDSLPEGIHVVDLLWNAHLVEAGWWLSFAHLGIFDEPQGNAYSNPTLSLSALQQLRQRFHLFHRHFQMPQDLGGDLVGLG